MGRWGRYALNQLGFPVVLKARHGYDGQGTFVKDIDALKHRLEALKHLGRQPCFIRGICPV